RLCIAGHRHGRARRQERHAGRLSLPEGFGREQHRGRGDPVVAVAGLSTLDRIRLSIFALISLTACLLASGLWSPELYRRLGYAIDDWRQVQLLSARPDPRIAVVDIDERSLEAIGPWPWPRAVIARLAQNLFVQYHAKAVGLDVMFPEAASPQGDHALLAVAHQFPLVFAQAFAMSANADAPHAGHLGGGLLT